MTEKRLEGKVALVTGGASGMGASHAQAIVREGGKVVIADVVDEAGQKLADEIGPDAAFVHLDVTDADQWADAVAACVQRFGRLNVLVNNAGIVNGGLIGTYTKQQWDADIAVNLTGPYLGMIAAAASLRAAAPSSIINISSGSAFIGNVGIHGYTASKWGLRGLTKSIALELAADNVRVNSVHPGFIETPMTAGLEIGDFERGPLGRLGKPGEVSNLIIFLASDESSFSTGSEFLIDGGFLAGPRAVVPE
jgi:3alpha(or 20beta)-hydroxysteroid dehydrogenase